MIKKDRYTREDGVELTRTYSDTDHLIRHKKSGVVYGEAIDVSENEEYEEIDGYNDLDGVASYDEVVEVAEIVEKTAKKINRLNLTSYEALSVKEFYPSWAEKIDKTIEVGYITLHEGRLWRARQTHTALEAYPPSLDTASLYEVIDEQHEGTIEDPIPYLPPMEIFNGKYYTQYDVLYLCTRDSLTALSHDLKDLIWLYVEPISR